MKKFLCVVGASTLALAAYGAYSYYNSYRWGWRGDQQE